MTVSMKAATKVTVRHSAKTAVVAALLPTLAAAQGIGGAMPDNCKQNLNQCSLKIWPHNSFPHRGSTQNITFSDGETLTCTSNGANTPRSCTLTGGSTDNDSSDSGNQGAASTGTDSAVVLGAQSQLRQLGYYTGPVDGVLEDSTKDAITRYQLAKRLPASGALDDVTLASLAQGSASPGTDSAVVHDAQSQLRQLGYYTGPVDGVLEDSTKDAITRYQLAKRLPASGALDDITLASLAQGSASPGTDSAVVHKAQFQLRQLGYYTGPVDGVLEDSTKDAITRYQLAKRLPASGALDDVTLASLEQEAASPGTNSAVVLRAQIQLRQLGYYTGPTDGDLEDSTKDAITRYQLAKRLPASGALDDATLASLGIVY
jgi:peptidoglycan hydrolase-like protein with peptidoglycan-binding domain